ncbi:MAG: mannose-phosphate guanylyltransferase [Candidatus Saccharibacteria bacterium]|nr:mannose-phosphate guanylyltransferase [Candidatus Saccharibacteria bacterium]
MIAVIIAGGSGTRLWPLSTPTYPKHLLKINGDDLSLMQRTYERAKALADKVYVVSEASHIHHVKDQLPDLPDENFIVEPARRGTASCIVAALVRIGKTAPDDEPIAFLSADHYIRDKRGFVHSLKIAASTAKSEGRIVLVGIEPDHPATGFGYIQKGKLLNDNNYVFNVHSFKEKPDFDTAQKYFESGDYLWNASYFVGCIRVFKTAMRANAPELLANYEKLDAASDQEFEQVYLGFENISIDYALIEKVTDLLVVPASFDWMDLGSFADLAKAIGGDKAGNHRFGPNIETEDAVSTFVHNYEDKPIAVIGLDHVVVINTPHGLLIVRKDMSQKVGDVSKRFKK